MLRTVFDFLSTMPVFRKAHGKRYPLATLLVLAGDRSVTAFAQFAALLNQERREAAGCFSARCRAPPVRSGGVPAPLPGTAHFSSSP